MKRNRTWLAWALSVGLVAYLLGAATAGSSTVTEDQVIKAYASGTALHLDALQAGGLPDGERIADVEVAFSAVNADSEGFGETSRFNENEVNVQPTPPDPEAEPDPENPEAPSFVGQNSSARGAGLELSLDEGVPAEAGTLLGETQSRATAPPDFSQSNEDGPLDTLGPLVYASLLHSDALAQWDNSTCLTTAQSPISYGRGYAAQVQLVDTGAGNEDGTFEAPLVETDAPNPARNAVQTSSFTYAIQNAEGNYGLVSEVHQTYAPIQIGQTLVIEVLGEWYVRTVADGISQATMQYGVLDPATGEPMDPGATVIRVSMDGGLTYDGFSLQDLSPTGIVIPPGPPSAPLQIALGEDPRAISEPGAIPNPDSTPTLEADGTHASGALDVVRIDALDAPAEAGSLADLRIGHFEADLEVPAGGFTCAAAATTSTTEESTTSTSGPTTSTSTSTTSTSTTTSTTVAPTTSSTAPPPAPTTAPPTTTTAPPPPAQVPTPIRVQPKTVG